VPRGSPGHGTTVVVGCRTARCNGRRLRAAAERENVRRTRRELSALTAVIASVMRVVLIAMTLWAGAPIQASVHRALKLRIAPLGPWCDHSGLLSVEVSNGGRRTVTIGVSPPRKDSAGWPNSYSYRILDTEGKQIGGQSIISTFDCVHPHGEVGPHYCGSFRVQIPAGGSVTWTLPLTGVPSDRTRFSLEVELSISVLNANSTDTDLEVRAVRTFRIDSSGGECIYAVGV
jgi:hypothetical protein